MLQFAKEWEMQQQYMERLQVKVQDVDFRMDLRQGVERNSNRGTTFSYEMHPEEASEQGVLAQCEAKICTCYFSNDFCESGNRQ